MLITDLLLNTFQLKLNHECSAPDLGIISVAIAPWALVSRPLLTALQQMPNDDLQTCKPLSQLALMYH